MAYNTGAGAARLQRSGGSPKPNISSTPRSAFCSGLAGRISLPNRAALITTRYSSSLASPYGRISKPLDSPAQPARAGISRNQANISKSAVDDCKADLWEHEVSSRDNFQCHSTFHWPLQRSFHYKNYPISVQTHALQMKTLSSNRARF